MKIRAASTVRDPRPQRNYTMSSKRGLSLMKKGETMRLRVQIAGIPRLKIAHWPPEWQQCMQDYLQTLYDRSGSEATLENYTSMLGIFFDSPKQACEMASSDVMAYISRPLMHGP